MLVIKHCSTRQIALLATALGAIQPLTTQSASESDRLEKLERAVEQLQKRNAELEAEVRTLKKQTAVPEAKMKTKATDDGKTYVEKSVVEGKLPLYVQQRGPELKLVLGGFIQVNAEGGDAFAFNGNFGQTAINDRFRLRRARINLTGDFAEQFDFKMEGDFATSDGLSNNRLGLRPRISGLTGISSRQHRSKPASIKHRSDWSSLLRTLLCTRLNAVCLLTQSHLSGKSVCSFGEIHWPASDRSEKIC